MSRRDRTTRGAPVGAAGSVAAGSVAAGTAADDGGTGDTLAWPGGWIATALYFGLALIYFLPAFLPGSHIYGSDYLAGAYFAHDFISERFAAGSLPKWVPYLYGGLPLFSNPGSAFYPFRFLADVLFPTSRIFPALYVIQFTLAGVGMYALTRELGARRWVALVAGLAFEFTGLTMSFVLAGHDGRIIVATFAPLFLFFIHRGVRTGQLAAFAGMAAVLGTSLLSFQIQSNYYLLLAGAAWAAFALVQLRRHVEGRALAVRTALGLAAVAVAFGMAAINFLPFQDYVDASPRGGPGRGYEYATSWSMPPGEVTGLALPERAGVLELYQGDNPFKLHTEYVGAVVVLLTLLGLWVCRRDRRWWFFAGLSVFALSISFGGYTPLYRLYYALLPGTPRFRAPSIAFFLVSTSLAIMAALTLERLAALRSAAVRRGDAGDPDDTLDRLPWLLAGVSALALVVLLASAGGAGEDPRGQALAQGAFRLALVTWLAAGALWLWLKGSIGPRLLTAALALLVVGDLWIVDRRFFETVEPPEYMFAADGVVETLRAQPGPFRVWVLPFAGAGGQPYRGHGNYLMHHDIEQAGGEHGNHIQRWGEFVGAGEQTYVDWSNFIGDLQRLVEAPMGAAPPANFLAAANIRYIVSMVRLPGLPVIYGGPEALIYEVPGALPRAWLAESAVVAESTEETLRLFESPAFDPATTVVLPRALPEPLPAPTRPTADPTAAPNAGAARADAGTARVLEHAPDHVRVATDADRRAMLVLADNYYDGWEAAIDGEPAPVHRVNHTLRGVLVPAGSHDVVFEFRPPGLRIGLIVSMLSALLVLAAATAPAALQRLRRPGAE